MHFNNANDNDISQFLHGVQDFADIDGDHQTQFDPALFSDNSLASFPQPQPSQPAHSNFNQAQRQTQSQSPALPQFKPAQNTYPGQTYGQNAYNQRPMGQAFDPQLLSRPTPSPGPFDQFSYQPQHMNYGQHQFDYSHNAFQQQRQSSTPSQAFRPQVSQQSQYYMNPARPSPQPQAQTQIQQSQHPNMSYPFQQGHQTQHRFIEPSMLNAQGQLHQNMSQPPSSRQMESSPYFTKAGQGATLDPRALQMQQYTEMQRIRAQNAQALQQSAMQPQAAMQHVMQFPAQGGAAVRGGNLMPKVDKPVKSSGSVSDSDDDLDIEDEEPPETRPAVITIAKPTNDERGKLLWEVVDAVWTPRNKPAPPEKIRSAVRFIGEAVRGLRDKWKETNDKLKKAENSNLPTEGLKVSVGTYREIMETLAGRVTKLGHPSIVKRLGENLILLSALYSFLVDRANAEDYDSPLIAAILQLGTKLETVDEEQLEKVKWTKVLVSRFAKKSTNESKAYAQQIILNAKKATARKKSEAAVQGPASPSGSSTGQVAGVKRQREGSETIQQAKKAAVKPSSKPLSVQMAEREKKLKADKVAATKASKPTATNGVNAAAVATRPKVTQALPQKASPFAGLMSAKKKPGTTNAERVAMEAAKNASAAPATLAAPKKESLANRTEVPAPVPRPAVSASSSSSFLGYLADMDKPKEAPKAKVEEILDETPEARAKRLRKESRRKLRVSWKPEGELVETRIFEHDSEEETGHDDSQMRDVGDTGKEGEMLKNRHKVEAEEDSDSSDDENPMTPVEYYTPSEVDFSSMKQKPEDDFENTNFIKGGGNLRPESASIAAQEKLESGILMRMYAAGEQPSSPTEPPEADDDDFSPVIDFGEPVDDRVRRREQRYLASKQAYQQPPPPQANGFDLASALSSMQPQQRNTQQVDWLRALSMANQQPQQQAQFQQQNPQLDLSKILAVAQQMQQQQPAYQAPVAPPPQTSSAAGVTPDVAAILSQLSGGMQPPAPPGFGSSLPTGFGDNPNPFPGASGSKIDRSNKKEKKRGKNGVPLTDDGLPINYKTKVCQFWLEGACTKGNRQVHVSCS
ncbi:hypothetical protein PMZ80_010124 [Knufia obscura]|uniref:C3H1-type domain-containing protein n=2 Tax=Knufia TaxID=430999 RepID=A0AAN8I5F7_9EURO|nr:hypothetical protein PMZ80_010124 [Knufia obscura]KAK5952864.1 hypothetical protein OHC33_005985 [Knufia fluminis]